MAKLDEKKKNLILLVLILVLVGAVVFVLFKDKLFGASRTTIEDTLLAPATTTRIPAKLDTDVFNNENFRNLKEYGPTDFSVREKGKLNPFEPFQINVK